MKSKTSVARVKLQNKTDTTDTPPWMPLCPVTWWSALSLQYLYHDLLHTGAPVFFCPCPSNILSPPLVWRQNRLKSPPIKSKLKPLSASSSNVSSQYYHISFNRVSHRPSQNAPAEDVVIPNVVGLGFQTADASTVVSDVLCVCY